MLYLGLDMGFVNIIGKDKCLLKLGVRELSTEELAFLFIAAFWILALSVFAFVFVLLALLTIFFFTVASVLYLAAIFLTSKGNENALPTFSPSV